jgi:hypothetical protein
MNEELVGFYSNHRQFLCLLPEKFDVTHLRFPSLISVMSIQKQKVHFICPGHRKYIVCEIRGRPIDKKYILYVLGTVSIQCVKLGVDL